MSLHIAKLFKNPLALAGAVLVLHIGAATAADSTGDAQQHARELLTGTKTAHSAPQSTPQSTPRDGKLRRPTPDAQELARQLLLGTTGSRVGGAEAIKQSQVARASAETARQVRPIAHGDAQAAARQLLLGQRVTSDAP
jgi:hypothetical protein